MKKLFVTCALIIAAIVIAPSTASAQATGATTVDINLPDIVILHYFSSVDITLTQAALGTFLTGTASNAVDEGNSAPASGGFTQDLGMTPTGLSGNPAAALLTLENAWAVRAISTAGGTNTQLAIVNTTPVLDHASTTASMAMTGVAVDDGTNNGATITFPAPGLVNPVTGDVELTLDMSLAINAGDYEGGVFTLTASNI